MAMSKGRMEPLLQNSTEELQQSRETHICLLLAKYGYNPAQNLTWSFFSQQDRQDPLKPTQDGVTRLSCTDLQWEEECLSWKTADVFAFIATFLLCPW